jgi:hypothetical protein
MAQQSSLDHSNQPVVGFWVSRRSNACISLDKAVIVGSLLRNVWLSAAIISFSQPIVLVGLPSCYRNLIHCELMKSKGSPHKAMYSGWINNPILPYEGVWGSGCIDPRFLDLCVVSFTPLPRGITLRYSFAKGGPQGLSGKYA